MMKKTVKWVLVILLLIGAGAGGYCYMNMPLAVSAVYVEPKPAELYFVEQGIAGVARTVEVYAALPGRITDLAVSEGDTVAAGDTICVVDTAELSFQIAQAESSIKSYEAQAANLDIEEQKARDSLIANKNSLLGELKALEAQESASSLTATDQKKLKEEQLRLQGIVVEQNEKELTHARDDLAKAETLYGAGAISVQEYTLAAKAVEVQEGLLEQNRQQLQIIESGEIAGDGAYYAAAKESINAQLDGIDNTLARSYTGAMKDYYAALIESSRAAIAMHRQKIADSAVTAPVSGVVTTLNIKDTNMLNAQTPAAVITPDVTNRVEAYVSTNDINEIAAGQSVDLILKRRGGDITYTGTVSEIDGEATVKLSVLGVEERRVKVTVQPEPGADEIKKGFDVDVRFVIYREDAKLAVPKTAFFTVDGKDTLWTVRDGKAALTEVTKGRELRTEFVVETGLEAGDWVITDADNAKLKAGINVTAE